MVFLASGLVCTIAFAGYGILDSEESTDGIPDWEVLEVCLADHSGSISHIHASISITINGNNILIPDEVGITDDVCPNGMRGVHTGSRGLGHQVCSEHVAKIERKYQRDGDHWKAPDWDYRLRDRQLAAAPIYSKEGAAYLDAMRAAGNYAFANRSALTQRLRNVLRNQLGVDGELDVVYDVSHNIAKVEEHVVHGKSWHNG